MANAENAGRDLSPIPQLASGYPAPNMAPLDTDENGRVARILGVGAASADKVPRRKTRAVLHRQHIPGRLPENM